jgi:hypothetical protein
MVMTTKPAKPVKHIPQRTCIGCRSVLAKRTLIRLVRTPEGVMVDPSGKMNGRGAYLHNQRSCWERGARACPEGRTDRRRPRATGNVCTNAASRTRKPRVNVM